jgi:outer membrane protein assembly factor BamB
MTGQERWASEDYGAAYSSPQVLDHQGQKRLVVFPEHGLVVLDPADGSEFASTRWKTQYGVNAPTPMILDDGRIFVSSGYGTGCAMFRFTGDSLQEVWIQRELRNQMDNSVFHKGYIYGVDHASRGNVKCINAENGEVMWMQRDTGNGTVTLAGDVLIVLTEDGDVVTAKAMPTKFEPLSSQVNILDAPHCWTAPVLSHGRLYVRSSRGQLVCMDLRSDQDLARLE